MEGGEFRPATVEEARKLRDKLHSRRKKLVFTNGCFDLLHAGHVRYLAQARALGDGLVVALNSDRSVSELKGPNRPVQNENDRAEILSALKAVDAVVIFDEPRATRLIEAIQPHIYAKGGDYTVDSLNPEERAALEKAHTQIEILPLVPGKSTTRTVRKLLGRETRATGRLVLGVLGSGAGSNFAAILRAITKGELEAEVAVAISDIADSGVMYLAAEAGIPAYHVDPGSDRGAMSQEAQEEICNRLEEHAVNVVVLAGFMRILKEPTLSAFAGRIVNVHPSLLPKYKGRNAPQQAIDEGEIETGCTVHLVTNEIDAGTILAQETVPIQIGDTAEELHARIKEYEYRLLPRVLSEWRDRGLPLE